MSSLSDLFQQTFLQEAIPDFIRKIFLLLENNNYQDVICWSFDGKTIIIKDSDRLVSQILPSIFKQNTMRSFIRQLNMYDFKKIRRKNSENELYFKNPHMIRGNIQELVFIKRKKRGYIEQTVLEGKETKSTFQRYNIFVYGVLAKLSKNLGISSNLALPSQLPKFMKDVLQFCSSKVQFSTQSLSQNNNEYSKISFDYCSSIAQDSNEDLGSISLFKSAASLPDEMYF